jgi:hypothetical protein
MWLRKYPTSDKFDFLVGIVSHKDSTDTDDRDLPAHGTIQMAHDISSMYLGWIAEYATNRGSSRLQSHGQYRFLSSPVFTPCSWSHPAFPLLRAAVQFVRA